MKFNNKILGAIFLALLLLYIFKKFISKPEVRSFKEFIVQVDTSMVDKIDIYHKGNSEPSLGSSYKAESDQINALLGGMTGIKPKQLISKDPQKLKDYELEDDTGVKLEVFGKGKKLESFIIGRFNFDQQARTATSYLRSTDENDIYSADGFLSMSFNKKLDDFRNKKLFKNLSVDNINKIVLQDGSMTYEISKDLDNNWLNSSGSAVDSLKAQSYLNSLPNMSGSEFSSLHTIEDSTPLSTLTFITDKQLTIAVKTVVDSEKEGSFLLASSLNPGSVFRSDTVGLYNRLISDFRSLTL